MHSNQVTLMHILDSSTDGDSSFFPGLTPADILKNKAAQKQATDCLQMLQRFNVHLEAACSLGADGNMIISNDQTKLKVY